jgi:plastocyanin
LRGLRKALACAVVGVLLVPGALLAADDPAMVPAGEPVAAAPEAVLAIAPEQATAGEPVLLDASASTGTIARYRWDVDGDGVFESDGGTESVLEHSFEAGRYQVGVQVEDDTGTTDSASGAVTVAAPAPKAEPAPQAPAAQAGDRDAPRAKPDPPAAKASPKPAEAKKAEPAVSAAASSSVTIENFVYSPATVTVDEGDTVSWTNRDSAPHTATGSGGTFNTGTLDEGQSGSATFPKAGSFAYICALHPNMKGTVVVTGSGGGGSDDPDSAAGEAPSAAAGTTAGSSGLPHTGLDLLVVALLGVAVTASGLLLRRLAQGVRAAFSPRG